MGGRGYGGAIARVNEPGARTRSLPFPTETAPVGTAQSMWPMTATSFAPLLAQRSASTTGLKNEMLGRRTIRVWREERGRVRSGGLPKLARPGGILAAAFELFLPTLNLRLGAEMLGAGLVAPLHPNARERRVD